MHARQLCSLALSLFLFYSGGLPLRMYGMYGIQLECKERDFIMRITRIWTLHHVKLMHSSAVQSKSSVSTWDVSCSCHVWCHFPASFRLKRVAICSSLTSSMEWERCPICSSFTSSVEQECCLSLTCKACIQGLLLFSGLILPQASRDLFFLYFKRGARASSNPFVLYLKRGARALFILDLKSMQSEIVVRPICSSLISLKRVARALFQLVHINKCLICLISLLFFKMTSFACYNF